MSLHYMFHFVMMALHIGMLEQCTAVCIHVREKSSALAFARPTVLGQSLRFQVAR